MNKPNDHRHPSAERLQAFLEEELPKGEHRLVEEHLGTCARCAAELEAWKVLFTDLGGLRGLRPHEGFMERVMVRVNVPEPRPLPARVRDRVAAFLGLGASGHVDATVAQDLVEGILPARRAARIRRHLEGCGTCADEVEAFGTLVRGLETLPRFAPSETFANHVMARVQTAPETSTRPATAPTTGWKVAARKLLPSTRRAWAALSGAAVTPVVTLGLVVYAVFSQPAITLGSLLSYVSWQVSDLAAAGWGTAVGALARGMGALGVQDLLNTATASPLALVAASVAYSALVLLALRVLYKNLITARSVDIRHAQISRS